MGGGTRERAALSAVERQRRMQLRLCLLRRRRPRPGELCESTSPHGTSTDLLAKRLDSVANPLIMQKAPELGIEGWMNGDIECFPEAGDASSFTVAVATPIVPQEYFRDKPIQQPNGEVIQRGNRTGQGIRQHSGFEDEVVENWWYRLDVEWKDIGGPGVVTDWAAFRAEVEAREQEASEVTAARAETKDRRKTIKREYAKAWRTDRRPGLVDRIENRAGS
ncbi:hypothetical protein LTR08_007905 [Meristemomyces frigidus]|nr:hypothetical protein LTR08_007905 [Meristemomyces frigidus]